MGQPLDWQDAFQFSRAMWQFVFHFTLWTVWLCIMDGGADQTMHNVFGTSWLALCVGAIAGCLPGLGNPMLPRQLSVNAFFAMGYLFGFLSYSKDLLRSEDLIKREMGPLAVIFCFGVGWACLASLVFKRTPGSCFGLTRVTMMDMYLAVHCWGIGIMFWLTPGLCEVMDGVSSVTICPDEDTRDDRMGWALFALLLASFFTLKAKRFDLRKKRFGRRRKSSKRSRGNRSKSQLARTTTSFF